MTQRIGRVPMFEPVGLHAMKDRIRLEYTQVWATGILDNLPLIVRATEFEAPIRTRKEYSRSTTELVSLGIRKNSSMKFSETHYERACFNLWLNCSAGIGNDVPFRRVCYFQFPLQNSRVDKQWGKVDLVGVTETNAPVVMELKAHAGEPFLRAFCEVLAYGIAIRKAWNTDKNSAFRAFWRRCIGETEASETLNDLQLAIMAPDEYWKAVFNTNEKKVRGQTPMNARQSLRDLLVRTKKIGYPISLITTHSEDDNPVPSRADLVHL